MPIRQRHSAPLCCIIPTGLPSHVPPSNHILTVTLHTPTTSSPAFACAISHLPASPARPSTAWCSSPPRPRPAVSCDPQEDQHRLCICSASPCDLSRDSDKARRLCYDCQRLVPDEAEPGDAHTDLVRHRSTRRLITTSTQPVLPPVVLLHGMYCRVQKQGLINQRSQLGPNLSWPLIHDGAGPRLPAWRLTS